MAPLPQDDKDKVNLDELRQTFGLPPKHHDNTPYRQWTENEVSRRKAFFLRVVRQRMGAIHISLEDCGISDFAYETWCKNDEHFRREVLRCREMRLDFAEAQLLKNIQAGKEASLIFFLKTQGKRRGYVERTEITGADGGPLEVSAAIKEELPLSAMQSVLLKTCFKGKAIKMLDAETGQEV